MVINVRGTSGSGKSFITRQVMSLFKERKPIFMEGRKQPICYELTGGARPLIVMGHYESTCGGCDTILSFDLVSGLIKEHAQAGRDVYYEGLLMSNDVKRCAALQAAGLGVKVIALTTSVGDCLASINARRRARKPDATDVNPKNTSDKHRGAPGRVAKLRLAGVECYELERRPAYEKVAELLGFDFTQKSNDYETTVQTVLDQQGKHKAAQGRTEPSRGDSKRPDTEPVQVLQFE